MSIYKLIGVSIVLFLSVIGLSCHALAMTVTPALTPVAEPQRQNVLLILADDLGVDILEVYGEGNGFPVTPTLDRMANEGVLFRNAWATPKCSPTRATILTGRYGFRTGITGLVTSTDLEALSPDEILIPEVLSYRTQTHEPAMIGKWHLGNCLNGQRRGPNIAGFPHYAGSFANLLPSSGQSFFEWDKTLNGRTSRSHTYATTDSVNDAVDWIHQQNNQPWFLYLAFNAPHEPFQIPPHDLVSPSTLAQLPQDESGNPGPAGTLCEGNDRRFCYLAMVEAMDAEIGRLLASIPPEVMAQTTVIFVGDNGTPKAVTRAPFTSEHAKNTLYEGGVNVPLIVYGAGVENPNRESAALVNTTDLFATTLELATGQTIAEFLPDYIVHDSMSIVPILKDVPDAAQRTYVYTELFHPTRTNVVRQFGYAIRNERYKLIRFTTQERDEFYDLDADPFEQNNLLLNPLDEGQTANHTALNQHLTVLRAPVENACPIVAECSDCDRCTVSDAEGDTCNILDTGRQRCELPDATEFSCPEGQTIHQVRCPCTGSAGHCSNRHDQQIVCAPSDPVADLPTDIDPAPSSDPVPDPAPEPDLDPAPGVEPPLDTEPPLESERQLQNVLLIVADDIGVDMLNAYGEGETFPATPTLDRMADEGVLFRNAWATPKCSSTRATILTGRYGFRTGVMSVVSSRDLRALSPDEIIIPEVLSIRTQTHEQALIGKWHLGNCLNGQRRGPNLAGFTHFAGSFANIVNKGQSFFEWDKTVNGPTSRVHTYATTDSIDDAAEWIHQQSDQPWFLFLSLHAPHKPWQIPPYDLVSPSTLALLPKDEQGQTRPAGTHCEGGDQRVCYVAMIEAMDTEIGRLLASIPSAVREQTTVIFVGDNGTPPAVTRPPFDRNHGKSTLYEGGVNVPLIVYGAGVENASRESAALVNTTDLFATILELATGQAAVDLLPSDLVHDSRSIVPILQDIPDAEQRTYVYTELFHPTSSSVSRQFGHAIRNERYKLIRLTTRQRDNSMISKRIPSNSTTSCSIHWMRCRLPTTRRSTSNSPRCGPRSRTRVLLWPSAVTAMVVWSAMRRLTPAPLLTRGCRRVRSPIQRHSVVPKGKRFTR
ncbi:MAG: hypothetical protein ETSY1_40960 [Candidatus Entotheonella factor]|uniref:Sulfatase N-terminal domain-containing protein n=1 Tax=Entotheonella factor TaxID=1429438 RepID=W4L6R9_ENTF1|nr:MAG: hypothetical protein ETSY1_40960 [Candidatus Entotheonella factor]